MLRSSTSKDFGKTLSLLWLFAILNMLFRDIHEMTMASTINEILSGNFAGNPMSEGVLLIGAFAVELLLLAFLLSSVLAPIWARLMNLVLAPVAISGLFAVPPGDPDDYFFAGVAICTFVVIFTLALRWKTTPQSAIRIGDGHAA